MTYEELQSKIAECNQKALEMETILQEKIDIEMQSKHPDRMAVLRMKEQISGIRGRAISQVDRLKKEFAMDSSPADVGDVIEAEIKVKTKGSNIREIIRMMRVERIEVAAFEIPSLVYYGTYIKADGQPYARRIDIPVYQKDIIRVVASKH